MFVSYLKMEVDYFRKSLLNSFNNYNVANTFFLRCHFLKNCSELILKLLGHKSLVALKEIQKFKNTSKQLIVNEEIYRQILNMFIVVYMEEKLEMDKSANKGYINEKEKKCFELCKKVWFAPCFH